MASVVSESRFSVQILLSIATILLLQLSVDSVSSSFQHGLPIVWSKSSQGITHATNPSTDIFLTIKFASPCADIYDRIDVPEQTKHFFVNWCSQQMMSNVIEPLEDLCHSHHGNLASPHEHHAASSPIGRRRRSFGTKLAGANHAFMFVDSLLGLFSHVRNTFFKPKQQPEEEVAKEQHATDDSEAEGKMAQMLELFAENLNFTYSEVEELQNWKENFVAQFGPTVTLVGRLTDYFGSSVRTLNEVRRDWGNGQLNLKLFDIFMLSGNDTLLNYYKNAKPISCYIKSVKGIATFHFQKENSVPTTYILTANPFSFQTRQGNFLSKYEYIGPERVIYDSLADCVVPLEKGSLVSVPTAENCQAVPNLGKRYWRRTCEALAQDEEVKIEFQVKLVANDMYNVYCDGYHIRVFKSVKVCPSYVFQIGRIEKFEILEKQTKEILFNSRSGYAHGNEAALHSQSSSSLALSQKINQHLFLDIQSIVEDFLNGKPCTVSSTVARHGGGYLDTRTGNDLYVVILLSILVVLSVVLVGIGAWFYCKTKGRNARDNYRSVNVVEQQVLDDPPPYAKDM